jgi:5-methylcytosine-specific restriction endonuclease McrA
MNLSCEVCGQPFEDVPSNAKRRYCSKQCANIAKGGTVEVQCHHCGKMLIRHSSRLKTAQRQFCDMDCRAAWQSTLRGDETNHYKGTLVHVQCSQCGKDIERTPSKVERNDHFFCGRSCYDEWRKVHMCGDANPHFSPAVQTTCAWCGVAIQRKPSKVGTNKRTRHFCCAAHRAEWLKKTLVGPDSPLWKGGNIKYYGPNWPEQQRLARERDRNTCQVCGRTRKQNGKELDVHHVVPFKSFNYIPGENENYLQANELTNLVCLCMRCHRKVERRKLPLQPRLV